MAAHTDDSKVFIRALYKSRAAQNIGAGAFGSVKKVNYAGRQYAIKHVKLTTDADYNEDDKTYVEDFLNEVNVMKHLRDSGLCPKYLPCIYDAFYTGEDGYLMMDLLTDGDTMDDYIAAVVEKNSNTSLPPLTTVAMNLRHALDEIHRSGVLHLDIKPQNIWVRADGSVQFLDFGLACMKPCRSKHFVGTPEYQRNKRRDINGKYIRDEKNNYYALAWTLYGSFDPSNASHPVKPIADDLEAASQNGGKRSRKFLKITRRRKGRVNIRRGRTLRWRV
jgi:serine/threonine protein kinase